MITIMHPPHHQFSLDERDGATLVLSPDGTPQFLAVGDIQFIPVEDWGDIDIEHQHPGGLTYAVSSRYYERPNLYGFFPSPGTLADIHIPYYYDSDDDLPVDPYRLHDVFDRLVQTKNYIA